MTHLRAVTGVSLARITFAVALLYAVPAHAQSPDGADARRIVKSMSDYLASQPNLSAEFDADLDIVTPSLEKIQFSASGSLLLQRPNKVRLIRKGGYSEVELMSDGKTMTIIDLSDSSYAQAASPGSVDAVIDTLRNDYGMDMPGADLLLTNSYRELMDGVIEAKHIGVGVIDGVVCDHVAFRNADTDWQLWVRSGDRPLPCQYVISSKTIAAAPDYRVRFRNWTSGQTPMPTAFNFTPSKGAKMVDFGQLSEIGELPAPAPFSSGAQ
jgi:hypothetical protein